MKRFYFVELEKLSRVPENPDTPQLLVELTWLDRGASFVINLRALLFAHAITILSNVICCLFGYGLIQNLLFSRLVFEALV